MASENNLHPGKIRWKCRRGMLELDMILLNFFDKKYASLSPVQQKEFCDFLDYPDPVLFDWLLGYAVPEEQKLKEMVVAIQCYSKLSS